MAERQIPNYLIFQLISLNTLHNRFIGRVMAAAAAADDDNLNNFSLSEIL